MKVKWIASDWVGTDQLPKSLAAAGHHRVEAGQDATVYVGTYQTPLGVDKLRVLRDQAPLILLLTEGSDPHWKALLHTYAMWGVFSRIVNIDGNSQWPGAINDLTLLTPIDSMPFGEPLPLEQRWHTMGFSGGVSDFRRVLLGKIPFVRVRDCPPEPTYENYLQHAEFLRRCVACLNLRNMAPESGGNHVKGRVLEAALAGACLFEPVGTPTSQWFTPGVDYVEYESVEHIKELMLAAHDRHFELLQMAEIMRRKVLVEHSPSRFWTQVFKGVAPCVSSS